MFLSEDQAVVDALKKILEDYEYLEYDEAYSRNRDLLRVKVTDPKPDRDISVAHRISRELGQVTGRYFLNPASVGSGPRNPETDWAYFNIREYKRTAVNPDTGQHYIIMPPEPEEVRQAILELDFPPDGIRVVHATERLAEKFQLSDEDKRAKNGSDLNFFRYDVVAPQFKRLLREGELKQPKGPKTPYFLTESNSDLPVAELRETPDKPEPSQAKRTALNPDTGEEYQIALPPTNVVKEALLDFDYPPVGIRIKDITEVLTNQFELTEQQSEAKGNYGLVWRRHVNIAANSLVNSGQLLRIKFGWIINTEQLDIELPDPDDDSPFSDGGTPHPDVVIAQNYQEHEDRLKAELRQKIMDNPPDFFEELVLDLLVKMEYGGSRADAEAVGRSGDGGIDGIIKEDKLGLDLIYVQAKRQQDKVKVGKVRDFTGALDSKGAQKGIFITTSDFTQPAKDFVEEVTCKRIILIDGKRLVQLMIDHNLGISLGNFYQLKEVDLDYFAIDYDDV